MQPPEPRARGEEADLAARLRDHDPDALGELFHFHGCRLDRIASRVVGVGDAADDRFDPARGTLSSYLTASSRGRALDLLRRERARRGREDRVASEVRESYTHVEDEGLRRALRDRLDRALAELPARQRDPIVLAYFGHLTYEEVASVLGRPVGTVKSRIRTGLRTLYDAIGSEWLEATGTDG
jgi:RNA polymerase sigma-70 factor (ECF subfamily)